MSPGDLLVLHDDTSGKYRIWKVEGVYPGCEGQEALIELRNLFETPGVPGRTGQASTTFVPEPLVRGCNLYTLVDRT